MSESEHEVLERIHQVLLTRLGSFEVDIWLFGPLTQGDGLEVNDVQIAVDRYCSLPGGLLESLRAELGESSLPCGVEIMDLTGAESDLRRRVQSEGVLWIAASPI